MIHAYDEMYLERARSVMAHMLDYAVNHRGYDLSDFFQCFLRSNICRRFEKGEASIVAGKSGIEITYEIMGLNSDGDQEDVYVTISRSPEYWLGWALAYYQWYRDVGFADIVRKIPIDNIRTMYYPYHEMDIRQFADKMDELCHLSRMETRLKTYRKLVGLSQMELAEKTGVPVRTIQQYEQRQKNINKASVEYIMRLSKALYCKPENLLEKYDV